VASFRRADGSTEGLGVVPADTGERLELLGRELFVVALRRMRSSSAIGHEQVDVDLALHEPQVGTQLGGRGRQPVCHAGDGPTRGVRQDELLDQNGRCWSLNVIVSPADTSIVR
jgi:hypothetical protein